LHGYKSLDLFFLSPNCNHTAPYLYVSISA